MLHLRCGDDIIPMLREAGVPGAIAKWADPLCEGPLRAWPDDASRRAERAAWLSERYELPEPDVLTGLETSDRWLQSAAEQDEVVLWFEHDLFDQAILVFLLDRLAGLAAERTTLICIASHPEAPEFIGLGQLKARQLADLYPERRPVTESQFALARNAWALMTAGDPEGLWGLGESRESPLPYLGAALRRYLAELPSVRNGLSQTESLGLNAIAAGADSPRHAYVAACRFEPVVWLGDSMFYATLRGLTQGPTPLLAPVQGSVPRLADPKFPATRFEVTTEGRAVLAGRLDWCRLTPQLRLLGAIPVDGAEPVWRWDERKERPVRTKDLRT